MGIERVATSKQQPQPVTDADQVIGTIEHQPNYDGHWRGEAWVTTTVHFHGTQAHRSEYEAAQWVLNTHKAHTGQR